MKTIIFLIFLAVNLLHAQWAEEGVAILDTNATQTNTILPRIASDGEGGAYICWQDAREGIYHIYAQRIDSSGRVKWKKNGIKLTGNMGGDYPRIVSDENGGAFVAWEGPKDGNTFVYVQRINKNGDELWRKTGVIASEVGGLFISMAQNEKGGVLLGWSTVQNVFLQRLDSLGSRVWSDSGVQVTNRVGTVYPGAVSVTRDGGGGAIVVWAEGIDYNSQITYTQRVDSSGEIRWQINGIQLSDTLYSSLQPGISSDSEGGAIINWAGSYPTTSQDTSSHFMQRINKHGDLLWGPNGIRLGGEGTGGSPQYRNTPDGMGGAFIGFSYRIQHVDNNGIFLWNQKGVPYYPKFGTTHSAQALDGNRGIFNFFERYPIYPDTDNTVHLRVQWIDRSGKVRFGEKGEKLLPEGYVLGRWPDAVSDGRGGAIVCWWDVRNDYAAVYALRIDTNFVVTSIDDKAPSIPEKSMLYQNYPNPFNPTTVISWQLENDSQVSIKIFDILGSEIAEVVNEYMNKGVYKYQFDSEKYGLSSGIYFYKLTAGNYKSAKKMILIR